MRKKVVKEKIVIVGAGSTGLSTALEIAKVGNSEVIVLEKSYVGSGQTGQCCGFVRTFYNSKEMIFSAHESMKQIQKICATEPDLKYIKKGLLVIDYLKNKNAIKNNIKLMQRQGIKARYLEESEIKAIYPNIRTKGICAGFDENAGYINPQIVINYLEKECRRFGVQILEKTKVLEIKLKNGEFNIKTTNGNFIASKLFNATAGYTNNINRMLDFNLPIKTVKINNAFYRLPLPLNKTLVAMADFANCFYIIPHKDFVDVSTLNLDSKHIIDLGQSGIAFNQNVIKDYLELISKRIKGAEKSAILGGFGSHIDISPDYYPILSEIKKIPNYYCAAGFSGTGFKHFPMIGKLMKEIILEEKYSYPELVSFFRYDRFQKKQSRENISDSYFISE